MQDIGEVGGAVLSLSNLLPDWSYLLSAPFSSSQGITAFCMAVLGVVFLLAGIIFLYHTWRARQRLFFLTTKLSGLQRNKLIEERESILQSISEDDYCGALWKEFDESLVPSSNHDDVPQLFNTIDAAHFFDAHTLARGMTESRLIAAMPGVLTAIGVLGTFAGLTLGLGGLGSIGGGETQQLKDGISGMIHAASIAFTTSFWGVLASVLFSAIEKGYESIIRRKISFLQDRIDHLFPRLTAEKMLMSINSHSKSSDETMLHLAEKIGDRMQEVVIQMKDEISSSMSKSLSNVLAPAIEKLVDSSENMTNQQADSSTESLKQVVEKFMDKFGAAGEVQGEMMRDSARNLEKQISAMTELQESSVEKSNKRDEQRQNVMTQTVEKLMEQIDLVQVAGRENSQAASDVVSQQQSTNEKVQKVSDDLLSFAGTIEGVSGKLSAAAEKIQEGNTKLAESSKLMSENILEATRSNQMVSQENQKTNQTLQMLLNQIKESRDSAEVVSSQLRASAEAGRETFEALAGHQEEYRTALRTHVQELGEQLSALLERYGSEVNNQVHNRMQAWDKETIRYTGSMQGVVNTMQGTVAEMQDMLESIQKMSK